VAALLAQAWADPAQRRGESEKVGHYLGGPPEFASGHQSYETGDVEPRRAPGPAGAYAVAYVIREEKLKRRFPGDAYLVRVRVYDHSIGRRHCTRRRKPRLTFDSDRAQKAGGGLLEARDVAKSGNADVKPPGGLENRRSLLGQNFPAVYRQSNHVSSTSQ
jgi:hypothetical protein